jgi:hypothetical protein
LFCSLCVPILDVGLLIVVGVSCEVALKRDRKALIDLVDGLSSKLVVLVSVTDGDLADHDVHLGDGVVERFPGHDDHVPNMRCFQIMFLVSLESSPRVGLHRLGVP